jgi:hypothetical protein
MEGAAVVESIVAIATVITAGATIAYVLVATGQLKAIRRQADVAAEQLRVMDRQADIAEGNVTSLERPWVPVSVDTPELWRPEKQGEAYPKPIAATVHATNCGLTRGLAAASCTVTAQRAVATAGGVE